MSLVLSAEMSSLQETSSRTSVNSTDSCFTSIEKILNQLSKMVKNHQINATYDPNNPKKKQYFTLFCTHCKISGHTKTFCGSLKMKKLNEEKRPPQPKRPALRTTQTNNNRQISTGPYPTSTLTSKEIVPINHTLQTAIVIEVTVILELFASERDPTRLFHCMTHCNLLN